MTANRTAARTARGIGAVLLLTLVAGLIVPRFKADRYRERIQRALETALGRKVAIGEVRFNLLTGPGFTVHDVSVAEDPALGLEPVAYVDRVIATPRILSLLTGHLRFASLRLEDAHLNLARADLPNGEYRWNLEPLLRTELIAAFPSLTIRGARINFKASNIKSVVYLLDSDLTVEPPQKGDGPWRFQFEGKPARADRQALGSGIVRARGTWKPGMIDAQLQLERSELGDVVAVLRGEDAGLHGLISGTAHFVGPMDAVGIAGRLRVEELHGWNQGVPKGEVWPLDLKGLWNSQSQQLELDAKVAAKGESPLAVHYLVEQYLTQPRWGVTATLNHFPAPPLVPLAEHMGLALPAGLEVAGVIDGQVGYSVQAGYGGSARVTDAVVTLPGSPAVRISKAEVRIENGVAHVDASSGEETTMVSEYEMATGIGRVRVSTSGMDVNAIKLLPEAKAGRWSGQVEWERGRWTGEMQLAEVEVAPPALASPVVIESAQCHLDEGGMVVQKIKAHAGGVQIGGEYRYQEGATHPHRLRVTLGKTEGGELEKLLLPSLRRSRSILDLPFGRHPLPEWLAGWHAEGTVQIAELETGFEPLKNVRARFQWDAARVTVGELTSGNLTGRAVIDLRAADPVYDVTARLRNQEWNGGRLTVDAAATMRGVGKNLMSSLRAEGDFVASGAEDDVDQLTGKYLFTWRGSEPQLRMTGLRVQSATEVYTGKGDLQKDGTVMLQLSTATKQAHLTGPVLGEGALRWVER